MKQVVILGGGFAGVSAALHLKKRVKNKDVNITLIDKNSYHLFTPSLYEVATSEEAKKNIAIPYSEIFDDKVKTVKGKIKNINIQNRAVTLSDGSTYDYDYLIIALGSEPAYFNVEGLKENSLPLKTLEDAVKIKEEIEGAYHQKVHKGKAISIFVGGGGFSGTEFAAELTKYRQHLAAHHKLSEDRVKISVIQGSPSLLKELDSGVSKIAQKRLEKHKVELYFGVHIKRVTKENIETDDGKKQPYDILVWTGGVRANSVLVESGLKTNGRGQVPVDDKMRVLNLNHGSVYAAGDVAEYGDPATNKVVPNVAEVAEDEGKVAAENVFRSINNLEPSPYRYIHLGYIVPLRGKYAVADLKKFKIIGFWGWVIQQFVFLFYLLRILPFTKALKRWNKFEKYLVNNS